MSITEEIFCIIEIGAVGSWVADIRLSTCSLQRIQLQCHVSCLNAFAVEFFKYRIKRRFFISFRINFPKKHLCAFNSKNGSYHNVDQRFAQVEPNYPGLLATFPVMLAFSSSVILTCRSSIPAVFSVSSCVDQGSARGNGTHLGTRCQPTSTTLLQQSPLPRHLHASDVG